MDVLRKFWESDSSNWVVLIAVICFVYIMTSPTKLTLEEDYKKMHQEMSTWKYDENGNRIKD